MSTATKAVLIVILALLVLLSAIFSASETAYTSLSRVKLEQEIQQGKKTALMVRNHMQKFGRTLATILIANNIVNVGSSSLITYLFTDLLGAEGLTSLISTVVFTPILVIFGEIAPKLVAKRSPLKYAKITSYMIEFFSIIFWPFTFPIAKITLSSKITNTEAEIQSLISMATKEGVLENSEAVLASNALELDSTKISEEMTRLREFVSVSASATVGEAKLVFKSSGHSRLPVKTKKSYSGILLLKDIVFEDDEKMIDDYVKEPIYISKNVLLSKALERLRVNKTHMALVTESTKEKVVIGLITLEDIVETLIGEIYDEHDKMQAVSEISHDKWIIVGNVPMKEVIKETDMHVSENDLELTLEEFMLQEIDAGPMARIRKGLKLTYDNEYTLLVIQNKKKADPLIEIVRKH